MPSILVTGAHSFISKNYVRFSSNRKIKVVSLKDCPVTSIDFRGIDTVLHLAAIVHRTSSIEPDTYYRINTELTYELASCAKASGVRQFVFMSTVKVYGDCKPVSGIWNESSDCNPADHYGRSKYKAEIKIKELENADFLVSVIRTPVVYGPGMKANMKMLMRLVRTCPVLPFGNINNKRHYTYVKNLVMFIDKIIELRLPGTFIAMDNEPLSTTQIVRYMALSLGKRSVLFGFPEFVLKLFNAISPGNYERIYGSFYLNNEHTRKHLASLHLYSTSEGLADMVAEISK